MESTQTRYVKSECLEQKNFEKVGEKKMVMKIGRNVSYIYMKMEIII